MLTEILMESLMSMDDETLDYVLESCSDEELEIINGAMEASMSAKDKEDFDTITRIQRKATSKGWGSVSKEDRDEFIDIMSNSKNLAVLKKAKKLGEKEANIDTGVKSALRKMQLAGAGIGAGAGALATNVITDSRNKEARIFNKLYGGKTTCDIKDFTVADNGIFASTVTTYTPEKPVIDLGKATVQGGIAGGVIGALAPLAIDKMRRKQKYIKDRMDVISQGDERHPDDQWKYNRKHK